MNIINTTENFKSPLIIDLGSSEVKAGFSGQERPKILFKTCMGETKFNKMIKNFDANNQQIKEKYIGEECDKYMPILKLKFPIEHGCFTSEEDILPLFNHVYSRLKMNSEEIKEHPVLITEPLLNKFKSREKISSVLFDILNVPALIFAAQPILSIYSTSSTSGAILESGSGVTQSCILYEGFSLPCSHERYNYGGDDVSKNFMQLLHKQGYYFDTSAEYQIVNDIKEHFCFTTFSKNFEHEKKCLEGSKEEENDHYFLPDGNIISIGVEKLLPAEILFRPDLIGCEFPSFQQMLYNSIDKADVEIRNKLYENVILCGGNTAIKNLNKRIWEELKKLSPYLQNIKIRSPNKPQLSAWLGGNIISSLEMINKMWVTQKEWDEIGDKIIHTKAI